eukprot:696113-Prorocentrum_minimum.AAC.2
MFRITRLPRTVGLAIASTRASALNRPLREERCKSAKGVGNTRRSMSAKRRLAGKGGATVPFAAGAAGAGSADFFLFADFLAGVFFSTFFSTTSAAAAAFSFACERPQGAVRDSHPPTHTHTHNARDQRNEPVRVNLPDALERPYHRSAGSSSFDRETRRTAAVFVTVPVPFSPLPHKFRQVLNRELSDRRV